MQIRTGYRRGFHVTHPSKTAAMLIAILRSFQKQFAEPLLAETGFAHV